MQTEPSLPARSNIDGALPMNQLGLTLVELLVVVAIIVVLLALLSPALDQAVYQAELVTCETKLRGLAVSAFNYAWAFNRRYPNKPAVDAGKAAVACELNPVLANHGGEAEGGYDIRPIIEPYFDINGLMNCPLSKAVDLVSTSPTSNVHSNYAQFYGWRYKDGPRLERGMRKVGDRFEFQGAAFHVLASDWEAIFDGSWNQNAHPDKDGVLAPVVLQDEMYGTTGVFYTASMWVAGGSHRGAVDRNFVFDDGSVHRFADVKQSQSNPARMADSRLVAVPTRANSVDALVNHMWLPRQ
jgi:prepilin-type N-terminal cleavage/methylation domain-containing protein